jgi:hypothetical protein
MRLKAAVVRKATKTRDDKRSAMYSPKPFEKIKKRVLDPNQSNEDPMPSPTVKRARTASYSPLVNLNNAHMNPHYHWFFTKCRNCTQFGRSSH